MLVLAGMLPTLPGLSMLPSVRLRLSQRLKLMLLFCMEDMAMVDLAMLVLDMVLLLLLLMATLVLAMLVLATLDLDTTARGLLRLSQRLRLMLVFCTEDMDMVDMVLDMPDSDMDMLPLLLMDTLVLDMPDMEDMVLDMAVESTMVKHQMQTSKSSKVILLFSA